MLKIQIRPGRKVKKFLRNDVTDEAVAESFRVLQTVRAAADVR